MNNFNSKRKIVYVHGEEAQLVQMAEQIHLAAMKRAQEAAQPGTTSPMTFYETDMETGLIARVQALERKYQMAMNLDLPPLLVPAGAQQPNQSSVNNNSVRIYRQAPTDLEMAEIFINRVIVRRRDVNIYHFDGRMYRLLTADQFHTLILETLRQELGINGSSKQIKSVAAAIMAEPRIEVKHEEVNASGICLRNGILDLNAFQLRPHSPGCFFTWMMDVDWLGEQPCPACDRFFEFAAGGDPVLIQRFWEALAYALLPDYNAKRFLVLMGKGDSGKSVWGATVESLTGRAAPLCCG